MKATGLEAKNRRWCCVEGKKPLRESHRTSNPVVARSIRARGAFASFRQTPTNSDRLATFTDAPCAMLEGRKDDRPHG